MLYRVLADLVFLAHFGFVLFVVFGGLLAFRWHRVLWVHLPSAIWGTVIEFAGWPCPLTPLENKLRRLGGEAGYTGSFVERYLVSILYPEELPRTAHIVLGIFVLAINLVIYWRLLSITERRRSKKR